jgi:DNA-binding HxlR family transcriptional regulator
LEIYLHYASDMSKLARLARNRTSQLRSGCPVSISLETFGDRWSLLIVRDLMVRGLRTFKEFEESGEGIASNILSDRLHRLEAARIITAEPAESDGRKLHYRLTEKGIDLAPVLLELLIWGARHEETGASCAVIGKMAKNRDEVLAEIRRRWRERDLTPVLPKFAEADVGRDLARSGGKAYHSHARKAARRRQSLISK